MFNPSSATLTTLYSFSNTDGAAPTSALVFGSDGNLYGTTTAGGSYGYGTVFKLSLAASAPPAPTGLTARAENGAVALNWTAASGASSYSVYEGISSGAEGVTPVLSGLTGTSANVSGLVNGQIYYFEVAAANSGGTSPYSNEVSATPPGRPAPVFGLSARPAFEHVALTWSAARNATAYDVYMGTASGTEALLAKNVASTSYSAIGLAAGTTYYFRVAGINAVGAGAPSAEASAALR
jgi:titin